MLVVAVVFSASSLMGCPTSRENGRDDDPPSDNRVAVPDVVGTIQAVAQSAITNAGLMVGAITEEYSDTVDAEYVISQTPAGGARVGSGSLVHLVVSRGIPPEDHVTVPDVVGMTQSGAEEEIISSGLTLGTVTEENSDSVDTGRVIRQQPAAGASVNPGDTVNLVVSRGVETDTEVPNVVDMPLSDAEVVLDAVGLTVGTVTEGYSDSVPLDHVISQEPLPGANVARGSAVQFVVSLGVAPEDTLNSVGAITLFYNPPNTGQSGFIGVGSIARFGFTYVDSGDFLSSFEPDTCHTDFIEFPTVIDTPLDPGEPGELSIGTNRAYLWKYMYTSPDESYMQIDYLQDPEYIGGGPGDLVNIFWPGGVDIKTFSHSTLVIHDPVFLQPQLPSATAPSIDFDQNLPLIWETHGDDTYMIFSIITVNASESSACMCMLRDDGSFTLPRYYLQAIKPDGEFMYVVMGNRQKAEHTTVELRDGTSGRLYIIWDSSVQGTGYCEE